MGWEFPIAPPLNHRHMPKSDLILLALDDSPALDLMTRALHVKYETAIAKDTKSLSVLLQETNPALLLLGERFDGHDQQRRTEYW